MYKSTYTVIWQWSSTDLTRFQATGITDQTSNLLSAEPDSLVSMHEDGAAHSKSVQPDQVRCVIGLYYMENSPRRTALHEFPVCDPIVAL